MVGRREQRNVHQTAGEVSWLDGRLSSRLRVTIAAAIRHAAGRLYTGVHTRPSRQVDTAGICRSSHVAAPPSRWQRQGKRDTSRPRRCEVLKYRPHHQPCLYLSSILHRLMNNTVQTKHKQIHIYTVYNFGYDEVVLGIGPSHGCRRTPP